MLIGRDRLGNVHERSLVEEELHAIVQLVIERDFGDRDVDSDLQSWPVELIESALDDPVVFLARRKREFELLATSAVMRTPGSGRAAGTAGASPAQGAERPRRRDGGGGFGALTGLARRWLVAVLAFLLRPAC